MDPEASDPSPDAPQIRRIMIFIYFPFVKLYPKSMNPHRQIKKSLHEIFHLRENGNFSHYRKILPFAENDKIHLEEKFH